MSILPVKNYPNLVKDTRTGAVINVNKKEMEKARERKAARLADKERLANLESDLNQIKKLLEKLIENQN